MEFEQTLHKRKYLNGQQTHEKRLHNFIRGGNINYNEFSLFTH